MSVNNEPSFEEERQRYEKEIEILNMLLSKTKREKDKHISELIRQNDVFLNAIIEQNLWINHLCTYFHLSHQELIDIMVKAKVACIHGKEGDDS